MKIQYPWYDSLWLSSYVSAKKLIKDKYPYKYEEFIETFEPLKTNSDFQVKKINDLFDKNTLDVVKALIYQLKKEELEKHELFNFGRFIIHDHPFFCQLHAKVIDFVSEAVGEEVESSYNFLSLYNNFGVCAVHMDAPIAKWTLDVCIEQSEPWPIYFSQVRPWPEDFICETRDWEACIKNDPENQFTAYLLQEGEAIIFSGSSQWHYRERISKTQQQNYCYLIFFHFHPTGQRKIFYPKNWANLFGIPELDNVITAQGSPIRYEFAVNDPQRSINIVQEERA